MYFYGYGQLCVHLRQLFQAITYTLQHERDALTQMYKVWLKSFFGSSQQTFSPQRQQLLFSELGAKMGGNDHLAFIKTEGEWREDDFDTGWAWVGTFFGKT